jgi:hypothetical protein
MRYLGKLIGFKTTEEEHSQVKAAAAKAGMGISDYLRTAVNQLAGHQLVSLEDKRSLGLGAMERDRRRKKGRHRKGA